MWRFYHVAIIARIALEGLKYYYYYYSRDSFSRRTLLNGRDQSSIDCRSNESASFCFFCGIIIREEITIFRRYPQCYDYTLLTTRSQAISHETPRNSSLWKYFYPLLHFHRDRSGFVTVTVSIDVFFPPLPSPINFLSQKFDHTLFRSRRRN